MSFRTLAWVLDHSESEGSDRLVLIVLAEAMNYHEGDEGWETCWPSKARIAAKARLSERQVQRCLQQLVALGELISEPHPNWTGRADRKPNRYRLRGDNLTPRTKPNGETDSSNGETPVVERGDTLVSRTIREPESINPDSSLVDSSLFASVPSEVQPMQVDPKELLTEQFESIWKLYPKKTKKPEARRAFNARVKAGADIAELRQAVVNYAAHIEQRRQEPDWHDKFIMHPTSFFGPSERWREFPQPPNGQPAKSKSKTESNLEMVRREREAARQRQLTQGADTK